MVKARFGGVKSEKSEKSKKSEKSNENRMQDWCPK